MPEGWTLATLGDICTPPQYGWTTSASRAATGPRMLRTSDISGGSVDWSQVPGCDALPDDLSRYTLAPGDIVVSRAGSVGISHLIRSCPEAVFASYLIRFRPIDPVSAEFVALFLRSPAYWQAVADQTTGIAIPNINGSKLSRLEVPLPPLAEQHRIAAQVDALLARMATTGERLGRVPAVLTRFRQSVLAAACSGRLTAGWRVGRLQEVGAAFRLQTNNGHAKEEPAKPTDVPDDWRWTTFEHVCNDITVGFVGPMAQEYVPTGIPFLRSQNVREFRFEPANLKYITPEFHRRIRKSALRPGDVAVVRTGNPGVACVIPDSLSEANCADLVVVRPSAVLDPHYACIYINSAATRAHVGAAMVGIAQGHFNIGSMRVTPVALPPLDEQHEIVRRVEALFALADGIERRVDAVTARVERLTQSILAKAYRGELVPTEAELARQEGRDYEPAAVLLERVRAARAGAPMARRFGKRADVSRAKPAQHEPIDYMPRLTPSRKVAETAGRLPPREVG